MNTVILIRPEILENEDGLQSRLFEYTPQMSKEEW